MFFEFLVFTYIELPQLSDFPEGATVAPSHGYVWENYKLQDVISYDTYYAILLKFGEVTLDIVIYILSKIQVARVTVIIIHYKALI